MSEQLLSPATNAALNRLEKDVGAKTAMIVRAVVEAKHHLAEFESDLDKHALTEESKAQLLNHIVNQVSSDLASMCTLMGKSFHTDIIPLVTRVTETAANDLGQLQ